MLCRGFTVSLGHLYHMRFHDEIRKCRRNCSCMRAQTCCFRSSGTSQKCTDSTYPIIWLNKNNRDHDLYSVNWLFSIFLEVKINIFLAILLKFHFHNTSFDIPQSIMAVKSDVKSHDNHSYAIALLCETKVHEYWGFHSMYLCYLFWVTTF